MPSQHQEHIFRARRTVAAMLVVGLGIVVGIAAALLLGEGRDQRRRATPVAGPASLTTPAPERTSPTTPTRRFEQARAVERIRRRMPLVAVAGRRKRQIALTFDDGPGPYTLDVLKVLDRLKVPATFFQVGNAVGTFSEAERAEILDQDVVLANHTWAHKKLTSLSPKEQGEQLDWASYAIKKAGGELPQLFRPPYGAYDQATLELAGKRHLLMVMWTIDSEDYELPGTKAIVDRVVGQARPGAIVLMHDAGGDRRQTVAALPAIIKKLRAKHYQLVTVPRLLKDNPPPLRQPTIKAGVG